MNEHFGREKRIGFRLVLSVLLVVILIPVLAAAVGYRTVLNKINHVEISEIQYSEADITPVTGEEDSGEEPTQKEHIPSPGDFINFLIVGQQSREGETERFADTALLCTLNPYEKTLTMTSILRDSFVKMPDYRGHTGGRIKLNAIYNLGSVYGDGIAGSMELMNLTLYHNFGIEVDHNFEVNFDSFVEIIDGLGGVELELTEAEAEYLNRDQGWVQHRFTAGTAHLNGMEALSYARMRKAAGDGESDINRTARQRKLVSQIIESMKGKGIAELQTIAEAVLPQIATSMDKGDISGVLLKVLPILPELKIERGGTCPQNYRGDMVDIYGDGFLHSVLRFDEAETKEAMRRITRGE